MISYHTGYFSMCFLIVQCFTRTSHSMAANVQENKVYNMSSYPTFICFRFIGVLITKATQLTKTRVCLGGNKTEKAGMLHSKVHWRISIYHKTTDLLDSKSFSRVSFLSMEKWKALNEIMLQKLS